MINHVKKKNIPLSSALLQLITKETTNISNIATKWLQRKEKKEMLVPLSLGQPV